MSNQKNVAEKVVEATADVVTNDTETAEDTIHRLARDVEDLTIRLAYAERPVLVKVKDAVVSRKRQLILGATTVAALGAAAYAVTHKDQILETVEHTTEAAAEGVELTAQDVKKTARKARTGSTTK